MFAPQSTDACRYCGDPATFSLTYLDDAEGMPVCVTHLGVGYLHAESQNELSFLPVSIHRVAELVAA